MTNPHASIDINLRAALIYIDMLEHKWFPRREDARLAREAIEAALKELNQLSHPSIETHFLPLKRAIPLPSTRMTFTPEQLQAKTDAELTELLATEVMGWANEGMGVPDHKKKSRLTYFQMGTDGNCYFSTKNGYGETGWEVRIFSPLTNWNAWRQVEEKVMEDEERMTRYMCIVCDNWCTPLHDGLMKADLRTRCIAALLAVSSAL